MSIYPNATQQGHIILGKLAEQQKNQLVIRTWKKFKANSW